VFVVCCAIGVCSVACVLCAVQIEIVGRRVFCVQCRVRL